MAQACADCVLLRFVHLFSLRFSDFSAMKRTSCNNMHQHTSTTLSLVIAPGDGRFMLAAPGSQGARQLGLWAMVSLVAPPMVHS